MSNTNSALKLTTDQAVEIIQSVYGQKCTASRLPGELDLNFRITSDKNENFILKISRPSEKESYLNFQQQLLLHIAGKKHQLETPRVILDSKDRAISKIECSGNEIFVRLLSWVPGRLWSSVNPKSEDLLNSLGKKCGLLTYAMQDFDHQEAHRQFEWDVAQSLWTRDNLDLFKEEEKTIVIKLQSRFENSLDTYTTLRKSIVHNDANDNNILVTENLHEPKVIGLIDFGDAVCTQVINDVAIACTYGIMGFEDPLDAALPIVKGYHQSFLLQEDELAHLYDCIAMRLVISVTKSALNKINEPDNDYLIISEKPAWQLLKQWKDINPEFAHYSFRHACGFNAHPDQKHFEDWANENQFQLTGLFPSIGRNQVHKLDLSVSSKWIGHQEDYNDIEHFQFKINKLQKKVPDRILAGGYLEPRPLYTSTEYDKIGNHGRESRTIHLGVDFWLPAYTPVHALIDGEVITAVDDHGNKEYGGLVILKHKENGIEFYTLYGHLTVDSATSHNIGDKICKGDKIAELGNYPENGNWAPHLHFQIMLSILDYELDFPGVAYHNQIGVWQDLCPDPNLLFEAPELNYLESNSKEELISYRKKHLGKGLSLQYTEPINIVRGSGVYLMDKYGNKYLDTVNNVAHVGHEHPRVVKAGQEQMALLNTNTRYLHEQINELSKELLATLPSKLSVVHFVNSGSEANELAIRMAKAVTGEKDIIASQVGYHGNTNMTVDISSYKFDGKGGLGAPDYTNVIPIPNSFRGKYQGENTGTLYADEVKKIIDTIHKNGRNVCAFIIEPIISCGGQVELPKGFLKNSFDLIRQAGGICISDEVQTGCGRMGSSFWGFQLHDVVPDIVTIGKPLGNGHPVAAVVCTKEVADKFANGMEYFNTFGGNPVSCTIAAEVLRVVKEETLQENALEVGNYLKNELIELSNDFPIIGDVRGQGLFLGIELADVNLNPLKEQTNYLINRMKDHRILMSSDGPDHNVLKIKPPMVFSKENANELLKYLRKILSEDFMKAYESKS